MGQEGARPDSYYGRLLFWCDVLVRSIDYGTFDNGVPLVAFIFMIGDIGGMLRSNLAQWALSHSVGTRFAD